MTPTMSTTAAQPSLPWERALVTAGTGFLGSHLCERLLDASVAVDCVDDVATGPPRNVAHLADRPGFRLLEVDLARPGPRTGVPAGPYGLVVHFACPASAAAARPGETPGAGSLGTRNALAVAERDGARFLLASTCLRHGVPAGSGEVPPGAGAAEGDAGRSPEALTTAYLRAEKADAGIVRVFPAYGPRMRAGDGRVLTTLIRQALAGGPVRVPGDGRARPSLCYVQDTVEGVLLVAASRSVRPVDIGGDPGPTLEEIARRVLRLAGSGARLEFTGPPAGSPGHTAAATAATAAGAAGNTEAASAADPPAPLTGFAHELFGWAPRVVLDDGLERTVAHFRDRVAYGRRSVGHGTPGAGGGVRHACAW